MSERSCRVCGAQEPDVYLAVAADAGVVTDLDGPRLQIRAGDVVCMRHTAVRPDGRYVRLEDGG